MRLYTHTGGIVMYRYSMDDLFKMISHETQVVGRVKQDVSLLMLIGPDEKEFVVSTLKKCQPDLPVTVDQYVTNDNIILTVYTSGLTSPTHIDIVGEHIKEMYVNYVLWGWFAKIGFTHELHHGYWANAQRSARAVILRHFKPGHGIGGKYRGIYSSVDNIETATLADVCYVPGNIMVYYFASGGLEYEWIPLEDITIGDDEKVEEIPESLKGHVYLAAKDIKAKDYLIREGSILICTENNIEDTYSDTIKNFMVIG